jgi:RNA polymerase sigma factor (sigma-70 family)
MAAADLNKAVEHLCSVLGKPGAAGVTDGDLLTRYVRQRDEAAFEALVRRHGPLVLGVCRRVLHNPHDAEDAFQATFLVLVRKAATLRRPGTVANWLYGVAYRTAQQARRAVLKRRAKEANVVPRAEAAPDGWAELRDVLDQELERLPEKYRAVVGLCDLQGATGQEAALHLGLPPGTVASRLARGRARLAKRLTRHGLAIAGAALAGTLSQNASAAVPGALVSGTSRAASLFAGGRAVPAGMLSARVVALTEGVLRTMLLTKLKVTVAVVLLVCALGAGAGAGILRGQAPTAEPAAGQAPAEPKAAESAKPPLHAAGQPKEDARWTNLQRRLGDMEKQLRLLTDELQALRKSLKPLAPPPAGKSEVRVFALKNLEAVEVLQTLKELFAARLTGGALSIAANPSTNTVLAQGSPENLEAIEVVIQRLEDRPVRKREAEKK